MKKKLPVLRLFVVGLLVLAMLATAFQGTFASEPTATPERATPATTPLSGCDVFGNCLDDGTTAVSANSPLACLDFEEMTLLDLLDCAAWLEGETGNSNAVDDEECSPFFSNTCIWDPFYGSCQWDMWLGVYKCKDYPGMPGYDCSYSWWHGAYLCEKPDNGWGW